MSAAKNNFSDLSTRIVSAIVLVAFGALALWCGGGVLIGLCALVGGLMIWELVRILSPQVSTFHHFILSFAGSMSVVASCLYPGGLMAFFILAPSLAGVFLLRYRRIIFASYAALILLGCVSLFFQRDSLGFGWVVWFVAVVIVTDVAGYFAGRLIGGVKLWPKVSPKKTWSGTLAGWVGAAIVGTTLISWTAAWEWVVVLAVFLSIASQIGDIIESAIKRHVDVKDSSNILPGHGGLLDRFDGMIAAAAVLLFVQLTFGMPFISLGHP